MVTVRMRTLSPMPNGSGGPDGLVHFGAMAPISRICFTVNSSMLIIVSPYVFGVGWGGVMASLSPQHAESRRRRLRAPGRGCGLGRRSTAQPLHQQYP